jgi:ABC-2 type transport system ATP-binding protein
MQTQFSNKLAEVKSYLLNGDFNLGRRRLLDLAYDLNNITQLKETIKWSQSNNFEAPFSNEWIQNGLNLCEKLKSEALQDIGPSRNLFQADSISKTYKKGVFALKSISLSVNSGEIIGVVGENGNGKTTLLRSIAGFLNAHLDANHYEYVPEGFQFQYNLKKSTGFIPQRIPRWYGKLIDNLRFTAAIHGIYGDTNDLMVEFVLERFGLTKYANHTWKQISSGYRTRFEVARLILQRPAVLILDEPLANLDINAQQTLLQDLRFIAQSELHPMGIILTSQQLFEVEKVADKVLFIQNGLGRYNEVTQIEGLKVFEIETADKREKITTILGNRVTEIRFNGGVYEIYTSVDPSECLEVLIKNKMDLRYFRDISNSTKRYF